MIFLRIFSWIFPTIYIPKVYILKMNNENKEENAVLGSMYSLWI